MGIQENLAELGITKGQCLALVNPSGGRFCPCDVDFAVTTGFDGGAQLAEDVLLGQTINKTAVILVRDKVATIGIHALLQNIVHTLKVGAKGGQHGFLILGRCSASLILCASVWLAVERARGGFAQLRIQCVLTLQAVNFLTQGNHIALHLVVDSFVLGRNQAVRATLAVQKCLGSLPGLGALFTQF